MPARASTGSIVFEEQDTIQSPSTNLKASAMKSSPFAFQSSAASMAARKTYDPSESISESISIRAGVSSRDAAACYLDDVGSVGC